MALNLEGAKSYEEDGIGLGKKTYTFPEQNVYVFVTKRIRFRRKTYTFSTTKGGAWRRRGMAVSCAPSCLGRTWELFAGGGISPVAWGVRC